LWGDSQAFGALMARTDAEMGVVMKAVGITK